MSPQTIDRIQHLFVVRIWQEPSGSAPPGQWRGSVDHVSSGQRYYFARIEDLNTFVLSQLNKAALGSFMDSGEDAKLFVRTLSSAGDEQPLSNVQTMLLQETVRRVAPHGEALAAAFYRRLHQIERAGHPLLPREMMGHEPKFAAMIGRFVDEVTNPETLSSLLRDLAKRCAGHGIQREHYGTLGIALLWALSDQLGDAFTPEVEHAWFAAYRFLVDEILNSTAG